MCCSLFSLNAEGIILAMTVLQVRFYTKNMGQRCVEECHTFLIAL